MGMFDWLRCDMPLPKMEREKQATLGHAWQTKDLDCLLDHYTITSGGILIKEGPYSTDQVKINDSVHFYLVDEDYEYTAVFRQGELVGIDLVEADGKSLEKHKEIDEEGFNRRWNKLFGKEESDP